MAVGTSNQRLAPRRDTSSGGRRHQIVATLVLVGACVPAFEGERPRSLAVGADEPPPMAAVVPDGGVAPIRAPADRHDAALVVDAGFAPPAVLDAGQAPGPTPPTWSADIEPIMRQQCLPCHASPTAFGAPMPLVTRADMMRAAPSDPSRRVHEVVAARVWAGSTLPPMPPSGPLSSEAIEAIIGWSAGGTP